MHWWSDPKLEPMTPIATPQYETCSACNTLQTGTTHTPIDVNLLESMTIQSPSRVNNFEFIWITDGEGNVTLDLISSEIVSPILICVAPGQVRAINGSNLKGVYISLREDFLRLCDGVSEFSFFAPYFVGTQKNVLIKPKIDEAEEMKDVAFKILKESSRLLPFRAEILKTWIKILLIYVSRNVDNAVGNPAANQSRDVEMVGRFMDLLKKQFRTMKRVSDYANQLCVTPNYLNQMVKRVSGYPASYHIQQQIVIEAKRQAAYTGMRMKEIADNLGFQDYAHFSKFFKTYGGASFSNFKSMLLR